MGALGRRVCCIRRDAMSKRTIEVLVDELADIINANFQTYITEVNAENSDFDLIDYDAEAFFCFEMPYMPNYPVAYLLDVGDAINPINPGNNSRTAADRAVINLVVVLPDDSENTLRRRAFRYCEAMRRMFAHSIASTPAFSQIVYMGISVSPPLKFDIGGQVVITANLKFSLDIAY
jgi:hypothetical protein